MSFVSTRLAARLWLPFVAFFLVGSVGAQTIRDTLFEEVRTTLEPLIQHLGNTDLPQSEAYNLYIVDAVLNLKDEDLEPSSKDQLYDLKIKQLEKDWGLTLRGQVNQNFGQFFLDQDAFDEQLTPLRIRAGIDWDLMKNGLLANQNRIQQLRNEKEADWLRFDEKRNAERLFYRHNVLIYFFNKEKIKLLRERKHHLETQLHLLYRIYYVRDILFEEVIAMKGELEQVGIQMKNYLDYNAIVESVIGLDQFPEAVDVLRLPVTDLDINRLLSDGGHIFSLDRLKALDQENDRLKNAPVHDFSLRLQLGQNLGYSDPGTLERTFTSAGVLASVPIDRLFNRDISAQIAAEEARVREQQGQYADLNGATELVNYYYEFNYKLKQYVEFLYKYMVYEEKLRLENVEKQHFSDYYQPFRLLKYHDHLQLIKLEILDLKQQLYLYLLKIYSKTRLKSLKDYLLPISANQYFAKLPASRTIFMNAGDFQKYDPHFIENYLLFNDFNYAILEEGEVVDISGMKSIQNKKTTRFLKTTVWNSAMSDPVAYSGQMVASLAKGGFDGVVMKILPEDFSGKGHIGMSELVEKLGSLFLEIQTQMPGSVIFLDVPADFPLVFASKLSFWAEKIILRAENDQQMDIIKKLPEHLLPFEHLPVCISLDVGRFKDRLKLEAYINQLVQDKRINDIVFKNFQAFVLMETGMFDD